MVLYRNVGLAKWIVRKPEVDFSRAGRRRITIPVEKSLGRADGRARQIARSHTPRSPQRLSLRARLRERNAGQYEAFHALQYGDD